MKSDVNRKYLKKYVIGFGDYTPPLLYHSQTPYPTHNRYSRYDRYIPLLYTYLTSSQYPKPVRYSLNKAGLTTSDIQWCIRNDYAGCIDCSGWVENTQYTHYNNYIVCMVCLYPYIYPYVVR